MTFKTLVAYSVGIFALAQQALQPVAANDADRDALLERLAQVSTSKQTLVSKLPI